MIRRHPQWVRKKNRYKVNFPLQVLAGSGIRISLPLQGFLGVFTSRTDRLWAPWISGTNIKGEAKPSRISYHLVSLCLSPRFWTSPYIAPEWRLSRHKVTAHRSTLINTHLILLNVMQCSCNWVFSCGLAGFGKGEWMACGDDEWMMLPPSSANGTQHRNWSYGADQRSIVGGCDYSEFLSTQLK